MFARIRARAPLVLASLLFGAGTTGLLISTTTGPQWGPFQPRNTPSPYQRVILVQVGAGITPPPLHELFTSTTGLPLESVAGARLQAPGTEGPETAPPPASTPAPLDNAGDAAVSAAGATATPPPPLRIYGIAFDDGEAEATPETTPSSE